MIKNFKKGFTLIELLVVIAIIGILSSIVLASLSSARSKGTDAAIKADLANMRAQAELYYSNNNNYGVSSAAIATCTTGTTTAASIFGATTATGGLKDMIASVYAKSPSNAVICQTDAATATKWAVMASTTSGSWCVDSTGASKAGVGSAGACN